VKQIMVCKLPKRNTTFAFILCTILVLSIGFTLNLNQPISTLDNDKENLVNETPTNLMAADEYIIPEIVYDHLWSPDGTKLAYIKVPTGQFWNCEIWIADKSPTSAQLTNHQLIYTGAQHNGLQDWKGDWLLIMIRFEEGTPSSYYGRNELWKIKTDGTGMTQITFTETNGIRTTWSNSAYTNRGTVSRGNFIPGTSLVYFSAHNGNGWYKSYVCNDDGTDQWYHISNPDYAFGAFMSPPGNKLLWTDASYWDAPSTLHSSNIDGSARFTIKSFSISLRGGQVILADGSYFIWHNNDNIYAIGLDGTNEHTVIDDAYINKAWNYNPVDTQELIISSTQLDGNNHLFKINVDGTDLVPLTDTGPYNDEQPILSPNGEYVSYLRLPYDFDKESNSEPYPFELVVKSLQTNEVAPELTNGMVSPNIGDQTTEFNFTVTYSDAEDNAPSYISVVINGGVHAMEKVYSSDVNYTDGCQYEFSTLLLPSELNYSYYFECNDGKFTNTTSILSDLKVNKENYNPPQLLFPSVSPIFGGLTTDFYFTVWYYDIDDNFPLEVNITIDSSIFSMAQVNPSDVNATDGMEFFYSTTLEYGTHDFIINCSDGMYSNSTNWLNGPEVDPLYGTPPIELLTPHSNSQVYSNHINFSWTSLDMGFGMVNYTLQISNITDFSYLVFQSEGIVETTSITQFSTSLPISIGEYYWRVKPTFENYAGSWSSYAKFNYVVNLNAPLLVLDSITPNEGTTSTIFKFTVVYTDLDNNLAEYVKILINGISYTMERANPLDNDFTDGSTYQYITLLQSSDTAYTIYFTCSDGKFLFTTSNFIGPLVNSEPSPDISQGNANFNSANTFAIVMTIGITIGCIVPFIAFTEILTKKVKLGNLSSKKIKKKEIKPK
ncbi:MAG: TolB family protein, partial [Candidatus Hermodarchaeota archaeon]